MPERIGGLLIGYLCGCFLTGELVARICSGKSASELGATGNPGMANIMASLGFRPGILTLLGDVGKCVLAAVLCVVLFGGTGEGQTAALFSGGSRAHTAVLYAALGCTLGHDFPFWRRFRGGKGVATTSAGIILYAPLAGLIANLAGLITVLFTKYLCIGGPVIPAVFALMMLLKGEREAAAVSAALTALSFSRHASSLAGIRSGRTGKNDLIADIRRKIR